MFLPADYYTHSHFRLKATSEFTATRFANNTHVPLFGVRSAQVLVPDLSVSGACPGKGMNRCEFYCANEKAKLFENVRTSNGRADRLTMISL
jgi:hypothetical protein